MSIQQYLQRTFSQQNRDIISYIFMFLSGLFWVIGFIYSNQQNLSGTQTCISRYSVQFVLAYIYARMLNSQWKMNNRTAILKLIFRSVVFIVHTFIVSMVQFYLPQNIYHVLGCTVPIFTFITNYLFNGIKTTKNQMIGVAMTFVGLILVINAEFLISTFSQQYQFNSQFKNYKTDNIYLQILIAVLFLAWTFVWSIALLFTKIQQYNSSEMICTSAGMGMIVYGMIYSSNKYQTQPAVFYPSLFYVGLLLTISTYLFTISIKITSNLGKASILIVINAILGNLVSVFRYGERINIFAIIGSGIIIFSVIIVLISKNQDSSKQTIETEKILQIKG